MCANSPEQHQQRLEALLRRVEQSGLKLNRAKSEIGVSEVEYSGHILTTEGLKPSPKRVEAIRNMSKPGDKAKLQTFLGMITYLGKFVPNLSDQSAPLRELLAKGVAWEWGQKHDRAFERLIDAVCKAPMLKYYDPSKEITLATDASNSGFGAVVLQDDKPVAFASRAVNSAEANYAPIEKEMRAVQFACERFHDYIYGGRVGIQTDHKPLIGIFDKPLCKLSPRLMRMRLALLKYDLHLKWIPGKTNVVPDALSRCFPVNSDAGIVEVNAMTVFNQLAIANEKLLELQKATERDPALQAVKAYVENGWPKKTQVVAEAKPFYKFKDEIVHAEQLLFRNHQLLIPKSHQDDILNQLHESHQGINKTLARAKALLFWPGLYSQILDRISSCSICLEHRDERPGENLKSHDVPHVLGLGQKSVQTYSNSMGVIF